MPENDAEAARNPPEAVRFNVTAKQHLRYSWQVCDPFLNSVLRREVLTMAPADGAVEVSVRGLAQWVNDAEKLRAAVELRAAEAARASRSPSGVHRSKEQRGQDPWGCGQRGSGVGALCMQPPPTLMTHSPAASSDACDDSAVSSGSSSFAWEDAVGEDADHNTIKAALLQSVVVDGALFFALAAELYEISRDPFHGGGRGGDVYTLEDHCPGFRLCCGVFGEVYDRVVRPVAEKLPDFSRVSVDDLLWFRKVVRDTFKLRPDDPNMTGPSESNLDSNWVNENVKKDQYFFNEQARKQQRRSDKASLIDITLSYVPYRKKPSMGAGDARANAAKAATALTAQQQEEADTAAKENDTQTYYLTELLQNPSWEPDDACVQCRQCGNFFKSVAWPFGVRAHHCRSCGHRLCAACICHRAHRSFAKLSKPGSSAEEPDERLVCGPCYQAYLSLEKHRYLGALFAFGGLDVANLSLCRTVSRQWRHAAELCISEYRLLLHQCEPDLKSVLTPVGVLLQNSVHLIATTTATPAVAAVATATAATGRRGEWDGRTAGRAAPSCAPTAALWRHDDDTPRLVSFHPEPALLLLKFIAAKAQWDAPSTRSLLALLGHCLPHHFGGNRFTKSPPAGASPALSRKQRGGGGHKSGGPGKTRGFSHWHFYCTACCSQMLPTYFAVKAAERIAQAPLSCDRAQETVMRLAQNLLSPHVVLRHLNVRGGPRGTAAVVAPAPPQQHHLQQPHPQQQHALSVAAGPDRASPEHTAAVANAESVVVWLLHLLLRDAAERDPARRRFQLLLETALPPLAAASVPLTIMMLCSLQSVYAFRSYDEELLGLWRTRIWEEVGAGFPPLEGPSSPCAAGTQQSHALSQHAEPFTSPPPSDEKAAVESAREEKGEIRRTLSATMDFFTKLDTFCAQPTSDGRGAILSRWLKEYCALPPTGLSPSEASATAAATRAATPPPPPPTFAVPSMGGKEASVPHPAAGGGPNAVSALRTVKEPNSMYAGGGGSPARTSVGGAGAPSGEGNTPSSAQVNGYRGLAKGIFVDLPHPIFNPFKPDVTLKSIRVSDIRVEETSSTRPVWLTFSTYSDADRDAYVQHAEAEREAAKRAKAAARAARKAEGKRSTRRQHTDPSPATAPVPPFSLPPEQLCEFLYKRENAERDQLMCISGRLLQLFLKDGIGDAQLANYGVLPLSSDAALIEKADGYILSKLPGTSNSADITTFLNSLGDGAKRNFLASAKLFLLMNYIFSIGDRHQGNVMVSFHGAILHIDFGFIFSEKTFVEKIAGTTMRVDNQFLAAVVNCRRALREKSAEAALHAGALVVAGAAAAASPQAGAGVGGNAIGGARREIPAMVEYDEFFKEAADWFLALRPHAAEFYELWLYAANRHTFSFTPRELAVAINCLFDRSASRESSGENFAATMKQSINVCRLKDVTHSGVQALKSYSGQVSKRVTDGGYEVVRSLGSLLGAWAKP